MTPANPSPKRARRKSDPKAPSSPAENTGQVRVLCVDDHAVLIDGLKAQFAIDGHAQVVGFLPTAENLIEEVERLTPDLVLLDIEMPGPDVFESVDRLHHAFPNVRFVFLSAFVRDGYLAAAYKCGAWGYFSKGDEPEDIVAGIVKVARSHQATFVMGPKVLEHCQRSSKPIDPPSTTSAHAPNRPPSTPLESLSQRELEVLRLIGKGLSRNEIAKELARSAKTIDGHQERILQKLAIQSRADLMRFAIREGLAEA